MFWRFPFRLPLTNTTDAEMNANSYFNMQGIFTKASLNTQKIMEKMISLPIKRFLTRNISPRSGSIPPPTVVAIVGYVLAVYVDSVTSVISVADVT